MRILEIYKCLCAETRLRILNQLAVSPLCVCHLQQILKKPQVKISQHLSYLKERGMVTCQRHQQWMIYSLPPTPGYALGANLRCLQDCVQADPVFQADRVALKKLMGCKTVRSLLDEGCCAKPTPKRASGKKSPRKK